MVFIVSNKVNIIIPIVAEDVDVLNRHFNDLKQFLPMKKIILIGNKKLSERLESVNEENIEYVNEDSLIRYSDIYDIIAKRTHGNPNATSRTGWYLQQFLKMQYAQQCQDEYYLIWDGDTVPLKDVSLFQDKHPVFHLKKEFHQSYFTTLSRILPDVNKQFKQSFIAEHMLINCGIMRELIEQIESNEQIQGKTFYEKILYAVDVKDLEESGFSEFETYGNYCITRYPDMYMLKQWRSLRYGSRYFDDKLFGESERKWLCGHYDAISFEKKVNIIYGYRVLHKKKIQQLLPFSIAKAIMSAYNIFVRGIRRCIKLFLKLM